MSVFYSNTYDFSYRRKRKQYLIRNKISDNLVTSSYLTSIPDISLPKHNVSMFFKTFHTHSCLQTLLVHSSSQKPSTFTTCQSPPYSSNSIQIPSHPQKPKSTAHAQSASQKQLFLPLCTTKLHLYPTQNSYRNPTYTMVNSTHVCLPNQMSLSWQQSIHTIYVYIYS